MTRSGFMCLLPGLFCIANAFAAESPSKYPLRCQSDDGFLLILSDRALDPERCKSHVARVIKAFAFVADSAAWKDRGPLTAQPLRFSVLGDPALKVLGYAQGPNLMVMKDAYMDNPLSEGTLAHELTHIQDLRQLRGKRLPSFMLEGRALTIGQAYRMHIGQKPGDYDRQMARSAATFTAEQAMELLDNYRGHGWNNQAIGTVVVEYMRVQWNGGVAGINPRLSRMIERIAAGREFDLAFQDEFKVAAEAFADTFAGWLRTTQNIPQQRLRGTIWQSFAAESLTAKPSRVARDDYVSEVIDIVDEVLRW
ncbi:MAG: hypothetical protein ACO3F9_05445 [Burkholderiales bacterium]